MKKPSKKGTVFEVTYASGRKDNVTAKTSKHYDICVGDLEAAKKTGAVVSYTERKGK